MSTPEKTNRKPNAAQVRLLALVEILSGNEVFGLRLTDVVNAAANAGYRVTPTTILHDLQAMEGASWAEQMADGKWRLAAKPIQVLGNFQWGLKTAALKVADVEQRYTQANQQGR